MSEPVVFYVNRSRYAWNNALLLLAALALILHALSSTDPGSHRVGLVFLPLCAIGVVGWALTLIYRYPRLVLTDGGITWKLPLVSRSWKWIDCLDLSKQETRSGGRIRIELRDGKRLVVPGSYLQVDDVYAAMALRYDQCKPGV